MDSSRLVAAACCPEGMPVVKPDAESGGPRKCGSPLPCDQDSSADVIPAARGSVGSIVRNVNTGTSAGSAPPTVMHRRVDDRLERHTSALGRPVPLEVPTTAGGERVGLTL